MKFLFWPSHFWYSCREGKYSFFQQDQTSLAISWILRQSIYKYIRLGKFFWWWWNYLWLCGQDAHRWRVLWTCWIIDNFYCQQHVIRNAYAIIVNKKSTSKHCPCVFKSDPRISLAERICRFHITCQRRVPVPSNPVITLFLQERLNFPAMHLHKCFLQISLTTNIITFIVWLDWSDIWFLTVQSNSKELE